LADLIYRYLPNQNDKDEIIFLLPELSERPSSRGGGMIKSKKKKNKSKKRNKSKKKRKTRKRRRSNKNSKK
jgi:hypothetical protein